MERLRLLLVLTVADIRAVGPGTWNSWKAALLRELYWRTEEVLAGGLATEGRETRVKAAKAALAEALKDWPKKDLTAHLARGFPSYWLAFDTEGHARHARMVRAAEKAGDPLTVDTRVDRYREATEITIYTADHPGLFSRIAGAMAVAGASIEAARIFTLKNGMALDSFYVRDAQGGPFERPDKLAKLSTAVEQTLSGRLKPLQELAKRRSTIPSRLRVFEVQPRVLVDNKASARHTVIEVNGRDRPGLLYQVTLALTKQQLIIHRAKISTYGERAVDVFYVQTALGGKVESEAKLKRIREKLLEALEQPSAKPASPAKAAKTPTKKAPAGKAAGKAAGKSAGKATIAPAE
jgi:[protein-PII] uridylyltransferase